MVETRLEHVADRIIEPPMVWHLEPDGMRISLGRRGSVFLQIRTGCVVIPPCNLVYAIIPITGVDEVVAFSHVAIGEILRYAGACRIFPLRLGWQIHVRDAAFRAELPDGAARVTFSGGAFSWAGTETHATQLGITALNNYVYPASLWYFANSTLKTQTTQKLTAANDGTKDWATVLSSLYNDATAGSEVTSTTRSVVMTDQAQYAVGRFDASVAALNANPYYDKNGEEVDVTNGFTLKGVLVGGQKAVDWKFQPITTEPEYTVYDNALNSGTWTVVNGTASSSNYTLLLETAPATSVNVALEFTNNGGDFMGADGVIPAAFACE